MTTTEAQKFTALIGKFYTWQMNDGYWHSSPYTNSRDVPISHLNIPGYETQGEARNALMAWATKEAGR